MSHTLRKRTRTRLRIENLETRCTPSTTYLATDLVSDQSGIGRIQDPNLVNAWGISLSPVGGAFWVSSNEADLSTLYTGDVKGSPLQKATLEVSIPDGGPTGTIFNGTGDFVITSGNDSGPARFIFVTESGKIIGWNPNVPMPAPSQFGQIAFKSSDGANYKGLATASTPDGNFLFAADFHNGKIDVFDRNFQLTEPGTTRFTDPKMPPDFAPFNIAAINDRFYVAFAKQDEDREDEVTGPGLGFVDVFDMNGNLVQRLDAGGRFNAPWAVVQAPAGFGEFSGAILVGNFGDGTINAFSPSSGAYIGTLGESPGKPLAIDGLWGLAFGNDVTAGDATTLYYAAGPEDETHGLFGKITANAEGTNPVLAELVGGNLIITGSRNDDNVQVMLDSTGTRVFVQAGGEVIGKFNRAALNTIQFSGFSGDDKISISSQITLPSILDGGAGDDSMIAGAGPSLMLGGSGQDVLLGGNARDFLIGGVGSDTLRGNGGDDILIGGSVSFDNDQQKLLAILGEWNSADDYAVRIEKIRNGNDQFPGLNSSTVIDDGNRDSLEGGLGQDWFLIGLGDKIFDLGPGEKRN